MLSDGSLTQEEIDALLQSSDDIAISDESDVKSASGVDSTLDEFNEIVVDTLDSLRAELRALLHSTSSIINCEKSSITDVDKIQSLVGDRGLQIARSLSGAPVGDITYLMSTDDALTFATALMNQDDLQLNTAVCEALQEALGKLSEPLITGIGNRIGTPIKITNTETQEIDINSAVLPADPFILNVYHIDFGKQKSISYYELLDPVLLERLAPAPAESAAQSIEMPVLAGAAIASKEAAPSVPRTVVQQGQFRDLGPSSHSHTGVQSDENLNLLMDVNMEMTVELGRTKKLVKEILVMGQGSVIELDKLAGEPVDILVNHRLIAKGEVVVIDENFGVRVTEIVSPYKRL